MLDTGDPAPDFYLPAADGSGEYMLTSALSQGPAVVAFTSGDRTAARTLLSGLAGLDWAALTDAVAVFGVVTDETLAREVAASGLPFPVLLDDGYVTDRYGVEAGRRALAVVDQDCTIRYAWQGAPGERWPSEALADAVRSV